MKYTGVGFRKEFAEDFLDDPGMTPAFFELAPENWMRLGGHWKKVLERLADRYPLYTHGLSLSIGSPDAPDPDFLREVKKFLDAYDIRIYSEHLSFSKCDNAHLYDLLPIPFRKDAVKHVANHVAIVQDFLQRPLTLEIVSYYSPVAAEMTELEFVNEVVRQSGCNLLLDVNNIYVNAFNHKYDARTFLAGLPLDKVSYIHMAGHEKVSEDLIIDTHGQPIIDPVYDLFAFAVDRLPRPVPVLLERDFNIPDQEELQGEMNELEKIMVARFDYAGAH